MQENIQVYQVKPEQVGQQDLHQFLQFVVSKEFENKEYSIMGEVTLDRLLPGYKGLRKIIGINVESGGQNHAIYFDVTEVQVANSINWLGTRY
jgi:hypothetical protein